MKSTQRIFAVIPAAGLSLRMGRPKLKLPLGKSTVIEHVLAAVDVPSVTCRVVTVRSDDLALAELVTRARATVVTPHHDPADMRQSVEAGLRFVEQHNAPNDNDAWMLLPGDSVGLTRHEVSKVLTVWATCDADILIPRWQGKGGHPTLFRWPLANMLCKLDGSLGVNALRKRPEVRVLEHQMTKPGVIQDMDTPDDYDAALKLHRDSRST
jgi:molybdenum cofactor cytidylyltransferase